MAQWYMLALYGAAFATFATIIHKKLLMKEHSHEFVTVIAIFNFLLSFIFLFEADFNFNLNLLFLILLISAINSTGIIFLAKAFKHLEISIASPLMGLEPAIIVLLSFLFLGEWVTYKQFWGLLFILVGGYTLEIKKGEFKLLQPIKTAVRSKYIHFGLTAVVLYSFSAVLTRFVINAEKGLMNPYTFAFFIYFFNAIILFFVLSIRYDGIQGVKNGIRNIGWLIIPASIFFVAHGFLGLLAISAPVANAGLVIAIKRTSIFFETLIGGELFHDKNLFTKVMASLIMVMGIFLIVS